MWNSILDTVVLTVFPRRVWINMSSLLVILTKSINDSQMRGFSNVVGYRSFGKSNLFFFSTLDSCESLPSDTLHVKTWGRLPDVRRYNSSFTGLQRNLCNVFFTLPDYLLIFLLFHLSCHYFVHPTTVAVLESTTYTPTRDILRKLKRHI